MKHSTRFLALALAPVACALVLAGCGGDHANTTDSSVDDSTTQSGSASPRMIGSDRRLAVRNECWYALDSGWLNNPNPSATDQAGPGGNGSKASWHYISTDAGALRYVVNLYQGYTSNLIPGTDGTLQGVGIDEWVRRFADDAYAMNYGSTKGVGHGLQCPSFVSLMLYRSVGYRSSSLNANRLASNGPATGALPGDVVFFTDGGWGHVGICVRNVPGSYITVVDSNFVTGNGGEVVGRHDVTYKEIGTKWKLYSGKGRWY